MDSIDIFTMALGLPEPWHVTKAEFIDGPDSTKELHLWLDFNRGYKFAIGSIVGTAYDTEDKTWRHLNFFQHCCYIHARVPRIKTGENSIELVDVPWARKGSGFTLMFEAYTMLLIEREMPVSSVSKTVKETAPRLWRVFNYWVKKAVDEIDLSSVRRIGVDETSKTKGHNYITQFVDLDSRKTIFVTEGRDSKTFESFKKELISKGGKVENIEAISMDMSPSFISGALNHFPNAGIIFDKFHIIKALNEALDEVRKGEHNENKLLKGHRFTLLHLKSNLSANKQTELETLLMTYPTIGKAYNFRESFVDIFNNVYGDETEDRLNEWCEKVNESSIQPLVKFVNLIKKHMFGIKTMFKFKSVNNGILEGLNSLIQLAKKRARGYGNVENLKNMVYFVTGKLELSYPHNSL
jgi:transposase